jgi:hypothetical protein
LRELRKVWAIFDLAAIACPKERFPLLLVRRFLGIFAVEDFSLVVFDLACEERGRWRSTSPLMPHSRNAPTGDQFFIAMR